MNRKKIISILGCLVLTVFVSGGLKATEECFEGFSRSVFKFNMAFDDILIEPIAKSYNKLPNPIKSGTGNFTSNVATLLSIPNLIMFWLF